jgi:hypothetical protein
MSNVRLTIATAAAVGLLAGYALNALLRSDPPAPPVGEPAHPAPAAGGKGRAGSIEAEIFALKAALDEERSRRGALEMDLALLRRQIARSTSPPAPPAAAAEGAGEPGTKAPNAPEGAPGEASAEHAHGAPRRPKWFDEADLVARGIDEHRAAWLRERFDAIQMDELYLRDEATREGWLNTKRYRNQLLKLRGEARESLEDDDYDLLLYASKRNNRVVIGDVLRNSPASAAGIQAGDVLRRYDDRAIFHPGDLISTTTQGIAGSTVAVDVERDGELLRVYLVRGPLGAQIVSTRSFPAAPP